MAGVLEGGDDIVTDLNSAYSSLSSAESQLSGDVNGSVTAVELVEQATNQLVGVQERLERADTSRDTLKGVVTGIKSQLGEGLDALNTIKASFEKIDNHIGSVQISGADEVVSPIKTSIKAISSDTTHLNLLFPSLIVLVVMFVSILLATTLVMMEKHSPAYFRNFITPVHDFWFVFSTYVTNMLIVLVQVVVIVAISIIFFSADLMSVALVTGVALLLVMSAFTFIGMFIGYVFNSEETGTLAAISVGSVFLLLSNLIVPLESVPESVRQILQYNPFVYGEIMLRKVLIYKQSFAGLEEYMIYFAVLSLVLFVFVMLVKMMLRRRVIASFDKKRLSLFAFLGKSKVKVSDDSKKKVMIEKSRKKSGGLFKYL
jgi:ABC-type multidrug transport system permease subunit